MSVRSTLLSPGSAFEGRLGKLANRDCDQTVGVFWSQDYQARVAGKNFLAHSCVVAAGELQTRPVGDFQWVRESAGSLTVTLCQGTAKFGAESVALEQFFPVLDSIKSRIDVNQLDGALGQTRSFQSQLKEVMAIVYK